MYRILTVPTMTVVPIYQIVRCHPRK